MSQALTLARPYARAAFALARDAGADGFATWSRALTLAAGIAIDPRVASLLRNPMLSDDDAVALLSPTEDVGHFSGFLALLAENRRLVLLPEISGLYEGLRNEAERVVNVMVTSASELPPGEIETIKAALRKRLGCDVEIDTAIDPSLIGGAIIDAGDVVIDGSLKGKLGRLAAALSH